MEQLVVTARNLEVGDLIPFPAGNRGLEAAQLAKLERVIAVGVDPQLNIVEVHSTISGRILIAKGLPGDTMIRVYREERSESHAAVDQN